MNRALSITPLLLLAVVVACQDRSVAPTAARPSFAAAGPAACPAHATVAVSDEPSLLSAIASAHPNHTIALNGMIELTHAAAFVTTDGLTLTCASPGSGLQARANAGIDRLVLVFSKHVRVEHLALDGTNVTVSAFLGTNDIGGSADHVSFVGNSVKCPAALASSCVFIAAPVYGGMAGVVVTDNDIQSDGTQAALQLQGLDTALVTRNRITALSPSTDGIRSNGSLHLTVTDNIVSGPWLAAIDFFDQNDSSDIERNELSPGGGDGMDLVGSIRLRFVSNTVQCGDVCFFGDGTQQVVVANNQFQSTGSTTGIHLQDGTDRDTVAGNTVTASVPSFAAALGGIRVRDGVNNVVVGNTLQGPWANSIAVTDEFNLDVERNSLQGAGGFGIGITTGGSFIPISITGSLFRDNRVTGAAIAGISARLACNNSFVGNDLSGNAGNVGVIFNETTGANTYAGNAMVVVDNGAFDCNGDGVNDPNIISGPGMARHGLHVGGALSTTEPQRKVHGILIQ